MGRASSNTISAIIRSFASTGRAGGGQSVMRPGETSAGAVLDESADRRRSEFARKKEVGMFADRWVKTLPWRWARNSAIVGTLICFVPLLGTPKHIEQIIYNGGLFWMSLGAVFLAVPLTLVFFVIGLCARTALWRALDRGWASVAESIPLQWTIGAVLSGLLIALAGAIVFDWHGAMFRSGGSMSAVARNVAYAVGVFGSSSLLGFVIGLASRRGLRRAISDDGGTGRDH
jgi:hypothetical protein